MFFIRYILIFVMGCAFSNSNVTKESLNRMEDLQFTYLEPSSTYIVADGKDQVEFTLKDKKGMKVEDFILFYSFNGSSYKTLDDKVLTSEEEGDYKLYAKPLKRTKSFETIIHSRKNLKTKINISKFASLQDLYLEDNGKKVRIGGKNSNNFGNIKYLYNGEELKNLEPLQNLNEANIEVYLNRSKLGDINLKLYDIKLEIAKVSLKVGESLLAISPKKIVDGEKKDLKLEELIVKNMDFSLRNLDNKEELDAGTYFISAEVEINGEKVHINEREVVVNYDSAFKNSEIIPLPLYLTNIDNLNFKINDIPFLTKSNNLHISDYMIIYKDNDKFFAFIIGELISASNLDIFRGDNIIDSIVVSGNREVVKLSGNKSEWPGLVNLGNTCFFNSAIKALASSSLIDQDLEADYDKNVEIRAMIRSLINAIRLGKESPFYNSDKKLNGEVQKELIQKTLVNISNSQAYERVDDREQHDCSEVLNRILESITVEEFVTFDGKRSTLNTLQIQNSLENDLYKRAEEIYTTSKASLKNLSITQNFLKSGSLKLSEKFSFEPISYEFFKFFNLGDNPTVQELVDVNLSSFETVEGYEINFGTSLEKKSLEGNYNEENGKYYADIKKIRKILDISNYFILNINRKNKDSWDSRKQVKDGRKVLGIRETLNFPCFNYLEQKDSIVKFEPIACTVHLGGSNGGHYIAYIKDKDSGEWYQNNDTTVSKKELNDNVGTVYTIIYEKMIAGN